MNNLEVFRSIETFIFDVDGVLTNGKLVILENGRLLREMHSRDGYAIRVALQEGYKVAAITRGKSSGVIERLKSLDLTAIYAGVDDKLEAYQEFVEEYQLDSGTILYMGDDLPDYEIMGRVGLPCAPSDAAREIKELSKYVSLLSGGNGCVRDVIEKVLKLKGQWPYQKNPVEPWLD